MRCANCGNELKAGSLYCDVCGHPVQIVPDYNEFDDYLDNLVGNDDRRTDGQKTAKPVSDRTIRFDEPVREQLHSAGQWNGQKTDRMSQSVKQQVRQDQTGEQRSQTKQPCEKPQSDGQRAKRAQQKKIIIISAVVCAVAIVILIAAITRNVSRSHDNSFDYQVKQAKAAYSAGNINSAVSYYEKALSIDSDNTDVRFALADIYMSKKDYDAALVLYQEIINIEIFPAYLDVPFLQFRPVIIQHILVEGIEAGNNTPVLLYLLDIRRYRTAQLTAFRFRDLVVLTLPEGEQQRFYAVLFLHVELVIVRKERIETDRFLFRIRVINPVRPLCFPVYHFAQTLIRVTRIDQYDMAVLFVILPD